MNSSLLRICSWRALWIRTYTFTFTTTIHTKHLENMSVHVRHSIYVRSLFMPMSQLYLLIAVNCEINFIIATGIQFIVTESIGLVFVCIRCNDVRAWGGESIQWARGRNLFRTHRFQPNRMNAYFRNIFRFELSSLYGIRRSLWIIMSPLNTSLHVSVYRLPFAYQVKQYHCMWVGYFDMYYAKWLNRTTEQFWGIILSSKWVSFVFVMGAGGN